MNVKPKNLLSDSFYSDPDVTNAAQNLLGKKLCSISGGVFTSGIISETEAYCGTDDRACHANNGKRTPRTEVMFGEPGHAYIYLCYGIHHLFNVVTNRKGVADAVLVRAVIPIDGIQEMQQRRGNRAIADLANGPGKFTQAMGITTDFNKTCLNSPPVWIEDAAIRVPADMIRTSRRIGVEYAGEDADRLWRYTLSPAIKNRIRRQPH
jgi:DNA-3-methyladenine glycosylase